MGQIVRPENKMIYETPLVSCWMGDDGILYSISKPVERTIENYRILFDLYKKLSDNGTHKICTIGDVSKASPLSHEVRKYISEELPKYVRAMALVSDTPVGKTVGTIFNKINEQSYPSQVFDNLQDAKEWIKQYVT
jgi:hypothetical protein